jgi:predicted RNA-binding Zn-ribbon protein involved in translation (DUF1610 family)
MLPRLEREHLDEVAPKCPNCGAEMIPPIARHNAQGDIFECRPCGIFDVPEPKRRPLDGEDRSNQNA